MLSRFLILNHDIYNYYNRRVLPSPFIYGSRIINRIYKREMSILRPKDYGNKSYAKNKARSIFQREALTDEYLTGTLKKQGLCATPELLELERIRLKLFREIKNQNK